MGGEGSPSRPDVRLALTAVCGWISTAALLGSPVEVCLVVVVAAAAIAAVAAALPGRRCAARRVVVVALAAVAGSAAVVGPHCFVRDHGPLATAAASGRTLAVDIVLSDDPRELSSRFGPASGRALMTATVRAVADASAVSSPDGSGTAGRAFREARGRVEVWAPSQGWLGLLPGQRVRGVFAVSARDTRGLVAARLDTDRPPLAVSPPSRLQALAGDLRAGLRDATEGLPDDVAGLLPGLVVGDTSRLSEGLEADFRAAGLTHLVAVSGTNCAIVTGAVLVAARRLGAGRRTALAVAAVALVGFVVLVRPSPSVLRAATLGWLALLLMYVGRPRTSLPALSAVVVVLLVVDPALARSPGFALSVLATGSIVVAASAWTRSWAGAIRGRLPVPRRTSLVLAAALAVPLAAQIACWPLIAGMGGGLSLVAVPANVLAEPAVAPATILGVATAVASPVSADLARLVAWLAQWPARWIVTVAEGAARAPGAQVSWPSGAVGVAATVAVTLVVALLLRRRRGRAMLGSAVLGCCAVLVTPVAARVGGWPPPSWDVVACDVGQGDAVVVRSGPRSAVVIDTGPEPTLVERCLRDLGVNHVPLLVLSHAHLDHVGGVAGVLRGRSVPTALVSPQADEVPSDVAGMLRAAGTRIEPARAGAVRRVGSAEISVLGPRDPYRGTRSDANNGSVVLLVRVAGLTVLLPGDAETEAQSDMLSRGSVPRVDVLKVPHHGSRYQVPGFLAGTDPGVALVGVGADNDYGHPATSTLDVLREAGAVVVRTDLCGDIAVAAGSHAMAVTTRRCGSVAPAGVPP